MSIKNFETMNKHVAYYLHRRLRIQAKQRSAYKSDDKQNFWIFHFCKVLLLFSNSLLLFAMCNLAFIFTVRRFQNLKHFPSFISHVYFYSKCQQIVRFPLNFIRDFENLIKDIRVERIFLKISNVFLPSHLTQSKSTALFYL